MIALLLLPLVIVRMIIKKTCSIALGAGTQLLWHILADSEMSALMWIPSIVTMAMLGLIPAPLPPESGGYIPRRYRDNKEGWFWKNIPTWLYRERTSGQAVTIAGGGTQRRPRGERFKYNYYSPKEQRQLGRRSNRRLAKSLQLIALTCMAGTSIARTTAFDSDSKQIQPSTTARPAA
jgi:hypothetical protein